MKKIRLIISVFMVVFVLIGWFSFFNSKIKSSISRTTFEDEGAAYYEDGLYQKSVESYKKAQAEGYKTETEEKLLASLKASYYDGTGKSSDYTSEYLDLCRRNPKQSDYWKDLLNFCLQEEDYNAGFSVCSEMKKLKVTDSALYEFSDRFEYYFSEKNKIYNVVSGGSTGYYSVHDGSHWRVITPDNEAMYEDVGSYIGGISSNNDYIIVYDKDARLIDKNDVVQAILAQHTNNMRAYGDGMIPMQQENGLWNYYNIQAKEYTIAGFLDASSFQNGKAVVKNDSGWHAIGTDGKELSNTVFSDVKLYDNGEFIKDGIFVAAVDGVYNLYNEKCEAVTSINAHDMDRNFGSSIAYCDNENKWGYIDNKGNIVIAPQYAEAKSFSNGVAGVSNGSKWAFVNTDNRVVSDYNFLYIGYNSSSYYCPVGDMNNEYYFVYFNYMKDR